MKIKNIGLIFFYIKIIIFLIIAILLLTEFSELANVLTNNQLLGLIVFLFVLLLLSIGNLNEN